MQEALHTHINYTAVFDIRRLNIMHILSSVALQYNNLASQLQGLSSTGVALIDGLLTYDPAKRLTAGEALVHPFFAEHPLPKEEVLMPTFPAVHARQPRKSGGGGGRGGWADLDRDALSSKKQRR